MGLERIREVNFRVSKTQPSTPADGNCLFNAISIAILRNDSVGDELRLRNAIEMMRNQTAAIVWYNGRISNCILRRMDRIRNHVL